MLVDSYALGSKHEGRMPQAVDAVTRQARYEMLTSSLFAKQQPSIHRRPLQQFEKGLSYSLAVAEARKEIYFACTLSELLFPPDGPQPDGEGLMQPRTGPGREGAHQELAGLAVLLPHALRVDEETAHESSASPPTYFTHVPPHEEVYS